MRRTERLFQIIQILRGAKQPVTAATLADEMEVSLRTIYRDIAELQAQHVPLRGEAGIGYILEQGYDMPPLMLTPNEIEAAVLGAQWAAQQGDPDLARGARDLIAKIGDIVPAHLRPIVLDSNLLVPRLNPVPSDQVEVSKIRAWIRRQGKLKLSYKAKDQQTSERVVWPVVLAYFENARVLIAWCELRQGFRHFRVDRMQEVEFLDAQYETRTEVLRAQWWAQEKARIDARRQQAETQI